jgi:hypothetical protein
MVDSVSGPHQSTQTATATGSVLQPSPALASTTRDERPRLPRQQMKFGGFNGG